MTSPPPTSTPAETTPADTTLSPEHHFLLTSYTTLLSHLPTPSTPPVPPPTTIAHALTLLPTPTSPSYLLPTSPTSTLSHIHTLLPALAHQTSPSYLAFVTGGVLPIAAAADNIVTALDQNVQVHFPPPTHSLAPALESTTLSMLASLLHLGPSFAVATFTTGATSANILGLAVGREAVITKRGGGSVAELGLLEACLAGGVRRVQVLTSMGHSSVGKAAGVVGMGRGAVVEVGRDGEGWRLDLGRVEAELERGAAEGTVSVVVVGAGEVNTGGFGTGGVEEMRRLRRLADRWGAWVHVDGAFGLFARALPKTDEFGKLHEFAAGLELADSIAADAHKILNVPYDCGVFFCKDAALTAHVFKNPNAVYLNPEPGSGPVIHSPLNIGIENSRRFRALPVYAVLMSEGREGIAAMVARMVRLARGIAQFVRDSEEYEWLPDEKASLESTFIIVLFKAKNEALNEVLVDRINDTGRIYVSGTRWNGEKAVRIAVSNWRVNVEEDLVVVKEVLTSVAQGQS
ncbi:pyridoxal phosphate-dependent transferase [Podospora conica]|nr:pyridoxal phosphate-dependent transferase [Schizothecium conicum]